MLKLARRYLRRIDGPLLLMCAACSVLSVVVLVSIGQNQLGSINKASVQFIASALGLMLALVIHWNVNVGVTELDETEMTQIEEENITNMAENFTKDGSSYNELGVVYQDPTTGQMYLLQEEKEEKK